uniref:Uncharacterized protein n=1 Tax=Meloidogyne enterolobii TaxID=390850 RepID=A0A6V7TXC8_MELEN|nr:unnamed protein product [Meloidogyne enterolobii]
MLSKEPLIFSCKFLNLIYQTNSITKSPIHNLLEKKKDKKICYRLTSFIYQLLLPLGYRHY